MTHPARLQCLKPRVSPRCNIRWCFHLNLACGKQALFKGPFVQWVHSGAPECKLRDKQILYGARLKYRSIHWFRRLLLKYAKVLTHLNSDMISQNLLIATYQHYHTDNKFDSFIWHMKFDVSFYVIEHRCRFISYHVTIRLAIAE